MAQTAGPQMIVYLHCSSILCLLCSRNALVTMLFVDQSVKYITNVISFTKINSTILMEQHETN